MINAVHALVFAEDAEAARAFFRDVLGFPYVDDGGGWLIFSAPPTELAVHPGPGWGRAEGQHMLFLMCDDIEHTVEDLRERGVEFAGPIEDEEFGRLIRMKVPGAGEIGLYQPTHASPLDL
jgi:catechol 2,3-dioxygenase-like lactoylglutathione lyase family enzyme